MAKYIFKMIIKMLPMEKIIEMVFLVKKMKFMKENGKKKDSKLILVKSRNLVFLLKKLNRFKIFQFLFLLFKIRNLLKRI
jgi:hypothetical protein